MSDGQPGSGASLVQIGRFSFKIDPREREREREKEREIERGTSVSAPRRPERTRAKEGYLSPRRPERTCATRPGSQNAHEQKKAI